MLTALSVLMMSWLTVNLTAFHSAVLSDQNFVFQGMSSVWIKTEHPKKKEIKRTEKTVIIFSLIDMIDEDTEFVNKSMSVRQLLKSQKINMSWMNFCVWSSAVYWELKCLLTKMSNWRKKRKVTTERSQSAQEKTANYVEIDDNTQFLSTIMSADKAFWISCTVWLVRQRDLTMNQSHIQADQGSDMNVIFTSMIKQLELQFHSLSDVSFADLMMKMTDHWETELHHWVFLDLRVERIWRQICCFITSEHSSSISETEHLSLLLRIPWLYSVNAIIEIRGSKIEIEDSVTEKSV